MPSKIKSLPPQLINAIAAGEVIERPASVVKELIENAIDAQASEITIRIQEGGKKLIQIIDNGVGMNENDLLLSIERHTTSKINSLEDLFKIQTLGFRGEALSSIAAVSRLEIISREIGCDIGNRISLEAGKLLNKSPFASSIGTTLTVHDLFFNTPARLKFLKTESTELAYITNTIIQHSLAHPNIKFRLIKDDSPILTVSPSTKLLDVIAQLFDVKISHEIIPINYFSDDFRVSGYISKPSLLRKTREHQFIFVNNRPIVDKHITQAVEKAYGTLIFGRNFPVIFLFLELDLLEVDVNVHPTKREVRFSNEEELENFVYLAVKDTLSRHELIPEVKSEEIAINDVESSVIRVTTPKKYTHRQKTLSKEIGLPEIGSYDEKCISSPFEKSRSISQVESFEDEFGIDSLPKIREISIEEIKIIGQVFNTYILLEQGQNLLIADQHAIAERIRYEEVLKQVEEEIVRPQKLLAPIKIEFTPLEAETVSTRMKFLEAVGFRINFVSGSLFLISAIPVILGSVQHVKKLEEIIHELMTLPSLSTSQPSRDEVIKMMACRSAIKAGAVLSSNEIKHLIEELAFTQVPYTCPHGRPTIINISKKELEKKFRRI